jgi:hypothetical protein
VDPVTTAVVGWATSHLGSTGSRGLRRLLVGDKQQNALIAVVREAISFTVEMVVTADDRETVREALLRESPDTTEVQIKDVLMLRTAVLSQVRPRLDILAEQGFRVDLDRVARVLADEIGVGIQENAARGGALMPLAQFLRDERAAVAAEEAVEQLRAVNRALNGVPGAHEIAGQVARVLLTLDHICIGRSSAAHVIEEDPLVPALSDALVVAVAHESEPGRAMRSLLHRLGSRGLDPRLLIAQLPDHNEALRRWEQSDDDEEMLYRLPFIRKALAEQICNKNNRIGLSDLTSDVLREALIGEPGLPTGLVADVLIELGERLPPLRSGSRQAVLVSHEDKSSLAPAEPRASMASLDARQMCRLPPRDLYLTGRDDQVQVIADGIARIMTSRGTAAAFLSGQPGVGTSTVAIEVARALAPNFAGGVLYFNLQGLEQRARLTPQRVAATVLKALDVATMARNNHGKTEGELYAAYMAALNGQHILLILDNALDAAHVMPLMPWRVPSCCVIVTSRDRDQDFADPGLVFPIDILNRAASVDLLAKIAKDRDGRTPVPGRFSPLCAELARLCDDVPLALRLVGAQISSRPESEITARLQYLVTRLQEESTRLDRMRSGERAVRAAISLSYLNLDEETRRLLRLSCTARSSDITAEELGYCLEIDAHLAEDGLERLVDRSLATQVTARQGYAEPLVSFGLFELVRLFSDERRSEEDAPEEIIEFKRRFTTYMRDQLARINSGSSTSDPRLVLDPAPVLTALQLAREHYWLDLGVELATGLSALLSPSTEPHRLQMVHELLVELYLCSGNETKAIQACLRHAAILKENSRLPEAIDAARTARKIAYRHTLLDLLAEIDFQLSLLAVAQTSWADALEASESAARTLLQRAKEVTALPSVINSCRFARKLDNSERAIYWARVAVDIADRLGTLSQRASAHFELGRTSDDDALESYYKAGELYAQARNFSNAAVASGNAAKSARTRNEAVEFLRVAVERWGKTAEVARMATALVSLSAALAACDDPTGATAALDHAINELTAGDVAHELADDDVALRLLLEIRVRRAALVVLGAGTPGDVEEFDGIEQAGEARLTTEIATLHDLSGGAISSQAAQEVLARIIYQEPRNPAAPYDEWWYQELGTEPPPRRALDPGR